MEIDLLSALVGALVFYGPMVVAVAYPAYKRHRAKRGH